MQGPESGSESLERGANVQIVVKFLRHGERDKTGQLIDLGREITREKAHSSGISKSDFDAVKAVGSNAGPKNHAGLGRSIETANIYKHEIDGDDEFTTRVKGELSYETLKTPVPYNHVEIYNSYLPDNFEELQGAERVAAAKKAQQAVLDHLISLNSSEAEVFKNEAAGAFASLLEHYQKMATRLDAGSKVLIPAGTHGGIMELLLQRALVRTDEEGKQIIGFTQSSEIGGEFDPSDSFNVEVATDENGKLKMLKVTFDSPDRPKEDMYLDAGIVHKLAEFYRNLHSEAENG